MSNILFINLKRNGDIFNTAALAESYIKENPHANAYILTYQEFRKATKPLKIFKECYTLDRKKITTLFNHALYSNGFAINELVEELRVLDDINWTTVVNFSSDNASTFLSNYIGSTFSAQIKGVHFGDLNNVNYQSRWDIIFNEISTLPSLSPVHFSTAYHGMLNTAVHNGDYNLKTIEKHEETVKKNFSNLRKNNTVSLIGLQLSTSQESKDSDVEQINELTEYLLNDQFLFPIVLIAPTDKEREMAKKLNDNFSNKLVVVESDFLALSSVLKGLDILVTPDTSVKHLADLNNCRIIECSNDIALSFKQGTRGQGNIIIEGSSNNATVIYNSIKFLLEPSEISIDPILKDNVYITYTDNIGWNLKPVAGTFSKDLLIRQLKRSYISLEMGRNLDWDIKKYFSNFNYSTVQNIIDNEKTMVSSIGRDLLGTLRSLTKISDSSHETRNFVNALDKLLNYCETDSVAVVSVIEFRALLENLDTTNSADQLKAVESLLYQLKRKLQIVLDCLNQTEKDARSIPVGTKENTGYSNSQMNA